jgi:hypothetical protein
VWVSSSKYGSVKKTLVARPEKKTLDFEKGRSAAKMATSTFAYKNLALVN